MSIDHRAKAAVRPALAVSRMAASTLCLLAAGSVLAQTPSARPTQPAAKPAAAPVAPAASARGFGSARGPILTRDELRACLSRETELEKRLAAQEAARSPLEEEKKTIAAEQAAARAEGVRLDGGELGAVIAAFSERHKAFGERLARWEARVTALNEAGRNARPEERNALNAERAELEKERAPLEAERKRMLALQTEHQDNVNTFNARIRALDARVAAWSQRAAAWNDVNVALEADRSDWVSRCDNRRYLEEDEIAIRSGR